MSDHHGMAHRFPAQPAGDTPVGSVVAFAGQLGDPVPPGPASAAAVGTTSPIEATGWMACDGRSLDGTAYPELFAVLGYLYGGSGGSFNIPNYAGYFLRGLNGADGVDPDTASRKAQPGGSQAGVGSTQGFALQTHEHNYTTAAVATASPSGEVTAATTAGKLLTVDDPATTSGAAAVQVSQYETRPVNIYVNYIIKFTSAMRPHLLPGHGPGPEPRRPPHGI